MSKGSARAAAQSTAFSVVADATNDGLRLSLCGDLDLSSVPEFERAVLRARRARPSTLVLDLRRLSFLDSCGLRAVLSVHRSCAPGGPALSVIAGEQARRMFDLTGVAESLPLSDERTGGDVSSI
jgi:anti-sigma B factor antagonist